MLRIDLEEKVLEGLNENKKERLRKLSIFIGDGCLSEGRALHELTDQQVERLYKFACTIYVAFDADDIENILKLTDQEFDRLVQMSDFKAEHYICFDELEILALTDKQYAELIKHAPDGLRGFLKNDIDAILGFSTEETVAWLKRIIKRGDQLIKSFGSPSAEQRRDNWEKRVCQIRNQLAELTKESRLAFGGSLFGLGMRAEDRLARRSMGDEFHRAPPESQRAIYQKKGIVPRS